MSAISNSLRSLSAGGPSTVPLEVICHCLQISRDEVEVAIENGGSTVKCIIRETGAGSGCTACHCTIRNMLEAAGHTVHCATPRMAAAREEHSAIAG